jgi:hypothetical protein
MAQRSVVFVDVDVYERVIGEIARGPDTYDFVRRVTEDVAEQIRGSAPVRTGAGKGSIRAVVHMGSDGWYGTASWDVKHYYMGIQNARRKFVEPVAARIRYV